MVERRECNFCGSEIEPGTGTMYVKRDGSTLFFCSHKCYKNMIELKRVPRRVRWTEQYRTTKETRLKILERDAEKLKKERELKKAEKARKRKKEKEVDASAGSSEEAVAKEEKAPESSQEPEEE